MNGIRFYEQYESINVHYSNEQQQNQDQQVPVDQYHAQNNVGSGEPRFDPIVQDWNSFAHNQQIQTYSESQKRHLELLFQRQEMRKRLSEYWWNPMCDRCPRHGTETHPRDVVCVDSVLQCRCDACQQEIIHNRSGAELDHHRIIQMTPFIPQERTNVLV